MTGQLTADSQGSSGFPCPCALLFFAMTIIMLSLLQIFRPDEITAATSHVSMIVFAISLSGDFLVVFRPDEITAAVRRFL